MTLETLLRLTENAKWLEDRLHFYEVTESKFGYPMTNPRSLEEIFVSLLALDESDQNKLVKVLVDFSWTIHQMKFMNVDLKNPQRSP